MRRVDRKTEVFLSIRLFLLNIFFRHTRLFFIVKVNEQKEQVVPFGIFPLNNLVEAIR